MIHNKPNIPQEFYDWCLKEILDPDSIVSSSEAEYAAYLVWLRFTKGYELKKKT